MRKLVTVLVFFVPMSSSFAADAPVPSVQNTPASPSVQAVQNTSSAPAHSEEKPSKSKAGVSREKDAEGTQAPNHFDTDVIFKSKYELNGKALEVDTD